VEMDDENAGEEKVFVCVECGYEGPEDDICPECGGQMLPKEEEGEEEEPLGSL